MCPRLIAHIGFPGPDPFVATGFFLGAFGASYGAWWFWHHPRVRLGRAPAIGLGVIAGASFMAAAFFPVLIGARPSLGRPSTTARLEIESPRQDEAYVGDPASIAVALRIDGGEVVPFTSLRLVPNEGHIHLYLDGNIVLMSFGTRTTLAVDPGRHRLTAEFVAVDHQPWSPRVLATVTIDVQR